jgi:hypothetical protein
MMVVVVMMAVVVEGLGLPDPGSLPALGCASTIRLMSISKASLMPLLFFAESSRNMALNSLARVLMIMMVMIVVMVVRMMMMMMMIPSLWCGHRPL